MVEEVIGGCVSHQFCSESSHFRIYQCDSCNGLGRLHGWFLSTSDLFLRRGEAQASVCFWFCCLDTDANSREPCETRIRTEANPLAGDYSRERHSSGVCNSAASLPFE